MQWVELENDAETKSPTCSSVLMVNVVGYV